MKRTTKRCIAAVLAAVTMGGKVVRETFGATVTIDYLYVIMAGPIKSRSKKGHQPIRDIPS